MRSFRRSDRSELSYAAVGATNGKTPPGFVVDHNRVELGRGGDTYQRAVAALRRWTMFDLGWVTLESPETPIEAGRTVAVVVWFGPIRWRNSCRVVYVVDEPRRFGFAYGTLMDHAESGEERFTVEWLDDGSVWYDILAFSRPRHPLAKLGNPLVRRLQKKFARDSMAAMVRTMRG